MKYISTRGQAPETGFAEACLAGLAPDGGLYVPKEWPRIAPAAPGEPYAAVAARVLSAFAGDAITCWFDGDASLRATTAALATVHHQRYR